MASPIVTGLHLTFTLILALSVPSVSRCHHVVQVPCTFLPLLFSSGANGLGCVVQRGLQHPHHPFVRSKDGDHIMQSLTHQLSHIRGAFLSVLSWKYAAYFCIISVFSPFCLECFAYSDGADGYYVRDQIVYGDVLNKTNRVPGVVGEFCIDGTQSSLELSCKTVKFSSLDSK